MIKDKILQHEDIHESSYVDFIGYHMRRKGLGVPKPVSEIWRRYKVLARVDDGRWIVDCRECNSALVVSRSVELFVCGSCGSPDMEGSWAEVVYPADREEVERLLLQRPASMGRKPPFVGGPRFFDPELETIDDLKRENEELGVGV